MELQPAKDIPEVSPVSLVSMVGLATAAQISKQRIGQLKEAGRLPQPFGVLDGERFVWTQEQAEQFARELAEHPLHRSRSLDPSPEA